MAVVRVSPTFEGRDAMAAGPIDGLFKNRQWKITTDSFAETDSTIYAQCKPGGTGGVGIAGTLPAYLGSHPDNVFYTCRSLTIAPLKAKFAWSATANYSTAPITKNEKDRQAYPNPVDRPLKIRKVRSEFQRFRTKDIDGNAVVNSSNDPYPAQPFEDARSIYRVEKHVAIWLDSWDSLDNTINQTAYRITDGVKVIDIPAERGLMKPVEISELKEENGYSFYTVSGEIHHGQTDEAWKLILLDEGFHYLDGTTRKRILIKDSNGADIVPAEAQLLDGSGGILAADGTPVFREFDWYSVASWSVFPFGVEI